MKRIGKLLLSRVSLMVILAMVQIAALLMMFGFFRQYFAWYYAACLLLSAVSVLHVVNSRSNPAYKIAWVIPILLVPLFGGPFYFLFRRSRLPRGKRRRARSQEVRYRNMMQGQTGALEALKRQDPEAAIHAAYLQKAAMAPVWGHTQSRYFPSGEDMFAQLIEDLKNAKRYIFMEYFIIQEGKMWDTILDILEERARAGVDVRVLYDDMGCLFTLSGQYARVLARRGVKARTFSRFSSIMNSRFNNRDHRKICVVDGQVGYTGGVNLADEYINHVCRFGHWKDTAVRLEGDAVMNLTAMFLSMWDFCHYTTENLSDFVPRMGATEQTKGDGWVLPYGDSPMDDENVGENAYLNLIGRAKKYIWLTTPYLILDNELINGLRLAAQSGVDVRIITPRIPDKKTVFAATRSNYPALLQAGVKIYEYLPGFIHAKMAVCDDRYAIVGTINLDFRSLFLHYECACWFCGGEIVAQVREDMRNTQKKCLPITPEEAEKIVPPQPVAAILRLFAPMM